MLPRKNRIKKRKDFEEFFKGSKTFKCNVFILKTKKNKLGLNRLAFVVSQKVSKKATERNKIRRRLSSIFGAEMEKIKTGTDLLVITLPKIINEDFLSLKKEAQVALIKSALIKK